MRRLVHDLRPPEVCSLLNPAAIYANNEISLRDVEVYGFDYDYTLAHYSDTLHPEIFNAARDLLVECYKYPEGIRRYDYNPSFAIRGLHYDIQKVGGPPGGLIFLLLWPQSRASSWRAWGALATTQLGRGGWKGLAQSRWRAVASPPILLLRCP